MFAVKQLPCDQCCSDVPSWDELTLMPAGQTNRGQIQAMFLCVPEAGTRSHARGLCISTGLVLVLFLDKALCALLREFGYRGWKKHSTKTLGGKRGGPGKETGNGLAKSQRPSKSKSQRLRWVREKKQLLCEHEGLSWGFRSPSTHINSYRSLTPCSEG